MDSEPLGPRARARAIMVEDVITVARRQLAEVGPAGLSVRSVTRELGIAASAVYRYFASRDHLLTALIIDSYERLGSAVATAGDGLPESALTQRWVTTWHATREWAVAHPHEYALVYGTPVIGYAAPQDTVLPATRVVARLAAVVIDAERLSLRQDPTDLLDPVPTAGLRSDAEQILAALPELGLGTAAVSPADALRVTRAWTELFGAISFELFGHFVGSISHPHDNLDVLARSWAIRIGLPPEASPSLRPLDPSTGRDDEARMK